MKQRISACMDGELDPHDAENVLAAIADSAELRAEWAVYHMVSDGMRGAPDLAPGFVERFSAALAAEPTVLAPRPRIALRSPVGSYLMYAAASFAAIAVVGWVAFTPQVSAPAPQIARQEAVKAMPKSAPQRPAVSPLKPMDHDYLLAHQAVSPSGAMQGVAPYVRTVSFGTEADAR